MKDFTTCLHPSLAPKVHWLSIVVSSIKHSLKMRRVGSNITKIEALCWKCSFLPLNNVIMYFYKALASVIVELLDFPYQDTTQTIYRQPSYVICLCTKKWHKVWLQFFTLTLSAILISRHSEKRRLFYLSRSCLSSSHSHDSNQIRRFLSIATPAVYLQRT